MPNDNFDELYDEFMENKRARHKSTSKKNSIGSLIPEDLPLWSEVKGLSPLSKCMICKREFDDEDIVEACMNCGNYYHYKHLREWLKIKGKCPACRV